MTVRRRSRDWLHDRLPSRGDDRGSLAMAMMAVLVGAMLGAVILPMVISQNKSTRSAVTTVHSLHAAQAGVDVLLGRIRSSSSGPGVNGDPKSLPCTKTGPIRGTAADGTTTGSYEVSVVYWSTTPPVAGAPATTGQPTAPQPMDCVSGYGTYNRQDGTATPRYAVITSTGKDAAAGSTARARTVVSTYTLRTDDRSISGGQFRLFPRQNSTDKSCMEAEDAVPVVGTRIVLRACSDSSPPLAQQVFAYRSDLSLQLASSVTNGTPNGLCIDTARSPAAHQANDEMALKTCVVVEPVAGSCATNSTTTCSPATQQWSIDDDGHLRDALADRSDIGTLCIHAESVGTPLVLRSCSGGTQDPNETWVPSPSAGAGMAGSTNSQLVNFRQFATCLDVTGQNPDVDHLILYSCKQSPQPAKVRWNQKFVPSPPLADVPVDTRLKVTPGNGTIYCLTSPLTNGGYVRVTPCAASDPPTGAYRWTMYRTLDSSRRGLSYADKYTIVDSLGRCLGSGRNDDLDTQYLKATVSTCDGSTAQKWNADPSEDTATIINTHEVSPPTPTASPTTTPTP